MLRLDMRWGMAMAVMVLAIPAPAFGQRLLETDGIELRGTARVVTYEASLCNVLEASHTEEEYERIKANHGQPLDVWQLDFSVYNGSGKWLDHLIALYSIESKWPDCTNWSGDGPGGGPSGTYSGPVQWTGTAGHIQETGRNVVAPGATLTATAFILVFHEDPPPQFANWSVNFTFGKSASAPESNADAARTASVPGTPPSADSPSEAPAAPEQGRPFRIRTDQTCAGQLAGTACWMELANQPECYVWNPSLQPDATVRWTGECAGNLAQGPGTLTWVWDSDKGTRDDTGRLQEGKKHGQWALRPADGNVAEGPYVEGEMHGHWVIRRADGGVENTTYRNGQPVYTAEGGSPSDRELSEVASEMKEMAETDDAICGIPLDEAVSITFILPLESWPEDARPFVIDMRAKNGTNGMRAVNTTPRPGGV